MLASIGLRAQTIGYEYDASGNRTLRKIVTLAAKAKLIADSTFAEDNLKPEEGVMQEEGERSFVVYPNPTRGQIALEIKGSQPKQAGKLLLYSGTGKLLQNLSTSGSLTPVDLTRYAAGHYILILVLDDKKYEWTIIKQ